MSIIHPPPTFGRWLKRLRGQHDLTQEQLTELSYCSVQAIRFLESGRQHPSLEMAERISFVLGAARASGGVSTSGAPAKRDDDYAKEQHSIILLRGIYL